jgi:uncharacterized RDD family membrane protein YckC
LTRYVAPDRDVGLQGRPAGLITRTVGFLIDAVAVVLIYDLVVRVVEVLVSTLTGTTFHISGHPGVSWILLILIGALYCVYPVAAGGRTLGMAIVGLRVVRSNGEPADTREAIVRLLALPLSFLTLGIGFLLIVIRRDGRALHDLMGRTTVVYGWDARAARIRFLVRKEDPVQLVEGVQVVDGAPAAE